MPFDLKRLRSSLKPFRLHWYTRLGSTNDHAAKLRGEGELFAPAVVLTGHQLAGRGRGANRWTSPRGCLTVTFVLPIHDTLPPHQLPLLAGLAVRNACAEISGSQEIKLKWPNDLLYDDRKIAGLLCERVHKADLIGLGLNINCRPADFPRALRPAVGSLSEPAGGEIDMTGALLAVAKSLHRTIDQAAETSFESVLREYDAHHALPGRRVRIIGGEGEPPVEGVCEGLDRLGRLLLRDRKTLHHVIAGHVELM